MPTKLESRNLIRQLLSTISLKEQEWDTLRNSINLVQNELFKEEIKQEQERATKQAEEKNQKEDLPSKKK